MRSGVPGVATGLAWTPVGGDILFIEATRMPGDGKLILTGQLGDVMKESAQAALSLVKARAEQLGIAPEVLEKSDIHVHVPAGATPKDGPSAGVAMFVALASLLTGRPVRSDVAMTGEISLRGLVLPIGGVKEKVLAALRAGITTVMLPARNRATSRTFRPTRATGSSSSGSSNVDEAVAAALSPAERCEVESVAVAPLGDSSVRLEGSPARLARGEPAIAGRRRASATARRRRRAPCGASWGARGRCRAG